MLVLNGILKPDEVARFREGLAGAPFLDGTETAQGEARTIKVNQQADSRDNQVSNLCETVQRIIESDTEFASYARPARWTRPIFNRYGPGQTYGTHVDNVLIRTGNAWIRTDLSYTLFLSDPSEYEGGALVLIGPDGEWEFRLPAGSMVIYPTGRLHRVDPVTHGVRLACIGWIQSLIRREDQREVLFDLARVRGNLKDPEPALLMDKTMAALIRQWGELG